MRSSRRLGVALGEGTGIGLAVGAVPGGRDLALNRDLAHGMAWLAAGRPLGPMPAGSLWRGLPSVALAFLMDRTCSGGGPGGS